MHVLQPPLSLFNFLQKTGQNKKEEKENVKFFILFDPDENRHLYQF